jgi:anaerobic magnesium-protoporphyrin IX monomethyl ester cyclase
MDKEIFKSSAWLSNSDRGCEILLVGFETQENLGLRSIAAYLQSNGVRARILPCHNSTLEEMIARVQAEQPRIIGFSLIFQRLLPPFAELIGALRAAGIQSHFTIGGHFPTIEFRTILEIIPALDSVVRHEGEETLLELYQNLDQPENWRSIRGIAFRKGQEIIVTPPRPLITNLDRLPFVLREGQPANHRGLGICSIAGSRGCYYDCTFCSIHEFYREPHGPKRRVRSPARVTEEMQMLYEERDIRIFVFQDDDIYMRGRHHRQWLEEFLHELEARDLTRKILWRISCRIDDLESEMLLRMKAAGLASVYLGIESGCDDGLKTFNKHYTVKDVYQAVQMLNAINVPFEFGFMILEPQSTLESVRHNVEFLKQITAGGSALANFCKTAPYAGTKISQRLKEEGRLIGTVDAPDYYFRDPRLNFLQLFISQTFNFRNFSDQGAVERLRFAKFDSMVVERFFRTAYDAAHYARQVRNLIEKSNASALETLSLAVTLMERCSEEQVMGYWPLLERWQQVEMANQLQVIEALNQLQARVDFAPQSLNPTLSLAS